MDKEKLKNDLLDRYFYHRGLGKTHKQSIIDARQEQIEKGLRLVCL